MRRFEESYQNGGYGEVYALLCNYTCPSSELSYNEENAKELWEESERYVREWCAVFQGV